MSWTYNIRPTVGSLSLPTDTNRPMAPALRQRATRDWAYDQEILSWLREYSLTPMY